MWIEDFRKRNQLEAEQLAKLVNKLGRKAVPPLEATVSDTLIYILENSKKPRTHPRIADLIATVCGATEEQRDSIVDPKHRGTWKRTSMIELNQLNAEEDKPRTSRQLLNSRPVVMIDDVGRIIRHYSSIAAAEEKTGISRDMIRDRCHHKIKHEFGAHRYTFRFANEWQKMSTEQKLKSLGVDISE